MSTFAKALLVWIIMLLLVCGLLLQIQRPAHADAVFTYQNCKHQAQFAAFVKTIPPAYTRCSNTHWVVVEYPAAKWALACKVYGAAGDPATFRGVTFTATHILLIEDAGDADPDTAALGTFIHEMGHAVLWSALTDVRLPEFQAETDAVYQHEYDVLGRDSLPTDAAVQEAWCEELRHAETPGDKDGTASKSVTAWGRAYFDQLFSPSGPVPPLLPVPDNYITPPADDVPPAAQTMQKETP